jgi:hypothetical protein
MGTEAAKSKAPSLGDEAEVKFQKVVENIDLPTGRKAILLAIEKILNGGGVQKLTIEREHPIKVVRLVRADDITYVPSELVEDDVMAAVRNKEIKEFVLEQPIRSFEYLSRAFNVLSGHGLRVQMVYIHKLSEIQAWLKTASVTTHLFGAELVEHEDIPDFVILLVATRPDDPEEVVLSLKILMEIPKKKDEKGNINVGTHKEGPGKRTR